MFLVPPIISSFGYFIYAALLFYFNQDLLQIWYFLGITAIGVWSILEVWKTIKEESSKPNNNNPTSSNNHDNKNFNEVVLNFNTYNDMIPPTSLLESQINYLKTLNNYNHDIDLTKTIENHIKQLEDLKGEELLNYVLAEQKFVQLPKEKLKAHASVDLMKSSR